MTRTSASSAGVGEVAGHGLEPHEAGEARRPRRWRRRAHRQGVRDRRGGLHEPKASGGPWRAVRQRRRPRTRARATPAAASRPSAATYVSAWKSAASSWPDGTTFGAGSCTVPPSAPGCSSTGSRSWRFDDRHVLLTVGGLAVAASPSAAARASPGGRARTAIRSHGAGTPGAPAVAPIAGRHRPRAIRVWLPAGSTSSSRAAICELAPGEAMSATTVGEPISVNAAGHRRPCGRSPCPACVAPRRGGARARRR